MKDNYVFAALTIICVYVLSVRRRRHDIKDNLISISRNMQVHQTERTEASQPTEQENTIATINLPPSNPPSPLSGAEILNTPTPCHMGEELHEMTLDDSHAQEVCMYSVYVFTLFSAIVYLYCATIPSNISYADVFGPEL